jgi:hypothetical protein
MQRDVPLGVTVPLPAPPAGWFDYGCAVLWCCAYGDFPIVRVDRGVRTVWLNDLTGASALAVDGDHVLLAAGYPGHRDRLALLRLDDCVAEPVAAWPCELVGRGDAALLQGLGDTLHIVSRGSWTRISVATMRAHASAPVG